MVPRLFERSSWLPGDRVAISALAAIILLATVVLVLSGITRLPPQGGETTKNIGITYLPLTPELAAHYDLRVTSGVLITEVVLGTPAASAGLKAGDIILSYNGANIEAEASLLEMIMACPANSRIVLEVWREDGVATVELNHDWR